MANLRFIQAQSFALQSSGASAGDTSITLQSFKYSDGTTNIVTADLGDQCYGTLEPNNGTQEEAIQFTGVTQNSDGTATLTGVKSVGFKYPYSTTTGLAKSHAGGVTFVISNDAGMYGNIVSYVNSVVASGSPTASDTTAGITKVSYNQSSNPRARSTLVSQNGAGAMSMLVNSFSYQNGSTTITFVGKTLGYINGSVSSTFVAPVSNPRYDLIVYRPSLTDCTSITGTEAASPSLPTPTVGDIVLCSIYHRVGETKILERDDSINGYISVWYEPTPYATATTTTNQVTSSGIDQSQTTQNANYAAGEANATTKHSLIAQSFVPTKNSIAGVTLWKAADTGTFAGTVKISLQADSNGSPSGSDLASVTLTNAEWLLIPNASAFNVEFTSEYDSAIATNTYWIVVTPSTSDNANHINLGYDNASAHGLVLKYNNSTDGWVITLTAALYFVEYDGVISRVVATDANGEMSMLIKPYTFVDSDATVTTLDNSSAETTVYSKYLRSGFFTKNSGIKVTAYGNIHMGSLPNTMFVTFRVKYGGTTWASFATTTISTGNNPNSVFYEMTFFILNQNALASQKTVVTSTPSIAGYTGTFSTGIAISGNIAASTATINTASADVLTITAQNSAAQASNGFTYSGCVIEKIG